MTGQRSFLSHSHAAATVSLCGEELGEGVGYFAQLRLQDKDMLVNRLYNDKVAYWSDYRDGDHNPRGHGKRIPYLGGYWHEADFVGRHIAIGDNGSFVGVMSGPNQWNRPERAMTSAEVETFINYLDRAFAAAQPAGDQTADRAKARAAAERIFDDLWQWFQSLKIDADQD